MTAVPIVVESTTADYFVLYVQHDLDADTTVDLPVSVTLGKNGTTTLDENVEALPKERYRVEKYNVSDPADVDGDGIDDLTELGAFGSMNPVNSAAAIAFSDGALAVPDRETFEALSVGSYADTMKFVLLGMDTDRPGVYFMNTKEHRWHSRFMDAVGLDQGWDEQIRGQVTYDPELVAPDGRPGFYFFSFDKYYAQYPFSFFDRANTLLAASMPVLDDNLTFYLSNEALRDFRSDLPLYRESRINLLFDEDIFPETSFLALNPGEGYGFLRVMELDERPNPRDVVIYEELPNELPRVAGIISTVPQTPLSHVNLRAVQDDIPNAFIRGALDEPFIVSFLDRHVYYTVTEIGWDMRAATRAEVDTHYNSSRPAAEQMPQRNLSVTRITPLGEIGFGNWTAFGVKAANVAVLGTLGFPNGTVPDGFAVPFYFYDEFMRHNDLYTRIETMLADTDFQTDFATQEDELKKLRKAIKKAQVPEWMTAALTDMHGEFSNGTSLRYRSSTNNEDLPGFSGAGLYDSKTQHAEETAEDGIAKSLKQVYASLWNFRAFIERDFHRIDHMAAAMGVLVHPNYSDELANGVAVSFDPLYGRDGSYYVNTQVGEDLVTNPDAHSVPEEILLNQDGDRYTVIATSNQVLPGQLLMSDDQLDQLRRHLTVIHREFAKLYGIGSGEQFAMEIEFKITSDNILAIKQARPWIFDDALATPLPDDATLSALTLSPTDVTDFQSGTIGYGVSVANAVGSVTVTPTANHTSATITVNGAAVASGSGHSVGVDVGSNTIAIVVTAEDGNTAKTYTVTVTRAAPTASGPAAAVVLSPSGSVAQGTEITVTMNFAGLEFDSDASDTDYTFRADVRNADACEGEGIGSDRYMYKVDEDPETRVGSVSASCAPGDYTVEVSISSARNAGSASATADFTVAAPVQQQPPSADAALSGLALSGVDFGAFDPATTAYTASVANGVTQTAVTPTTNDGGATYAIKLGGVAYADGVIPLAVGGNVITIEVTAEDGNTAKTYTVTVTRAAPTASGPAAAVVLSPSGSVAQGTEITVTMNFAGLEFDSDASDTDYTFRADVRNADSCEGGGMGNDRYMYKVDEDPETRVGSVSASCAPGDYTVEVSISSARNAGSASATADFTVAAPVQQQPPSTDAALSGLALSGVDFGAFDPATTAYTASVANGVTQTAVTPTTNDGGATYAIRLGGVAYADGVIPLAVGGNVITIEVTAEDGNTAKTYTVTVTRAAPTASGPAAAVVLSPSGSVAQGTEITVTMNFAGLEFDSDASDTDYTFRADVRNADACEGGGMGNDRYMYKVDEDPETRVGSVSASCAPGDYTVEVSISSARNAGSASATADFTVAAPVQQQPPSADAALSGLALSGVDFGAFDPATTAYTASVANGVTQTAVTPTTNDGGATYAIRLGGVAYADGVIPLAVGGNVITIEVTAEDGNAARAYTVTVTRAAPSSADAALSGLALSGVDFGAFDPATTAYTASVANGVTQTAVTPTTNDGGATYAIRLGGVAYADGVIPLAVGGNVITIEVTAEDGNAARAYTVTITRAGAAGSGDPPEAPDKPTGSMPEPGSVMLDWNDVAGADSYDVRYYYDDWVELPAGSITIVFDGSGAQISGLPDWRFHYFSVRAVNEAGASEWSGFSTIRR